MSRIFPTRRARAGFSLVELIAAMVVLSTIAAAVGAMMPTMATGSRDAILRGELHEEASTTVERLVREWRAIDLNSSVSPTIAPSISSATANSLTWASGTISLSGTSLMLTLPGSSAKVLQPNVGSLTLTYYNESNSALTPPLSGAACYAIRRIGVDLTLTRDGTSERVRTKVYIRSTMQGGSP